MSRITTSAIAMLALAACATELETTESTAEIGAGCPSWGCGENSPVMGPYSFWEGNTKGLPNRQDIRFVNFQIGNKILEPRIINGAELTAYDPVTDTSVTGAGLTGGWFNVSTPTGMFQIIVVHVNVKVVSDVMFWVGPVQRIETYELHYTDGGSTQGRLCNNPPPTRDPAGGQWKAPAEAILFTGDRYDADSMRVTASSYSTTLNWFNIGCAGSVLAKLHLNRHTTAGTTSGYNTSSSTRQALLKMYVSDVCGNGHRWTKAGTPLHWQNPAGWQKLNGLEFAYESRWGANGALCMDTHRLGDLYGDPADPNGIYGDCSPPPCNGVVSANPAFPLGTYLVSAVPLDPN